MKGAGARSPVLKLWAAYNQQHKQAGRSGRVGGCPLACGSQGVVRVVHRPRHTHHPAATARRSHTAQHQHQHQPVAAPAALCRQMCGAASRHLAAQQDKLLCCRWGSSATVSDWQNDVGLVSLAAVYAVPGSAASVPPSPCGASTAALGDTPLSKPPAAPCAEVAQNQGCIRIMQLGTWGLLARTQSCDALPGVPKRAVLVYSACEVEPGMPGRVAACQSSAWLLVCISEPCWVCCSTAGVDRVRRTPLGGWRLTWPRRQVGKEGRLTLHRRHVLVALLQLKAVSDTGSCDTMQISVTCSWYGKAPPPGGPGEDLLVGEHCCTAARQYATR